MIHVFFTGGGSGGSIWIECEEVVGHGKMTANGGDGNAATHNHVTYQGGGGAGGRISIQSKNINKLNITMHAYGGMGTCVEVADTYIYYTHANFL